MSPDPADLIQMVTVEVNLKAGDEQPEQHLDDGEHIERVIVPLNQLYDKLKGKCARGDRSHSSLSCLRSDFRRRREDRGRKVSSISTIWLDIYLSVFVGCSTGL